MKRTSFLTLGGWDPKDLASNITWFETGEGTGWNITLSEFKLDGETIIKESDAATIMFETGYPYIGLTEQFYDKVSDKLMEKNPDMECKKGEHWGLCRAQVDDCDQLNLDYNLAIDMHGIEFTVPLRNMAVHTYMKQEKTTYCSTQISLLRDSQNTIVLGGAFYAQFVGVFDAENELIGFAESVRALPGSTMKCFGLDCPADQIITPGFNTMLFLEEFAAITLTISAVLIITLVVRCRLRARAEKKSQAEREISRAKSGKRGYTINDEKEDDESDDEELTIDHQKPTLN